ncbi:MAG: glycosyltransferase [Bacteroidaceae bacterium]|nr:glycosyltransferase [Bacteroidaceae bacterium]
MTKNPLISIITIVYNNKEGFEITAKSIVSQSALDKAEWIIIDADSKDGTKNILERYKKYTTYTVSEPDKGRYDGMNKGIAVAKGEYTIFMNAGDAFNNESVIEKIINEPLFGKVDYIAGNTYTVTSNKVTGKCTSPASITARFFFLDTLCHQSTFIRTKRLQEFGGYDINYKITADAKFFYEDIVLRNAKYGKTDIFISRYDINGISSIEQNAVQQEKTRFISNSIPPRILIDLNRVAFGETYIERISSRLNHKGVIYNIISYFAILLYSPIAIKNRIKMKLRNL